jgi:hypothetical protein
MRLPLLHADYNKTFPPRSAGNRLKRMPFRVRLASMVEDGPGVPGKRQKSVLGLRQLHRPQSTAPQTGGSPVPHNPGENSGFSGSGPRASNRSRLVSTFVSFMVDSRHVDGFTNQTGQTRTVGPESRKHGGAREPSHASIRAIILQSFSFPPFIHRRNPSQQD